MATKRKTKRWSETDEIELPSAGLEHRADLRALQVQQGVGATEVEGDGGLAGEVNSPRTPTKLSISENVKT